MRQDFLRSKEVAAKLGLAVCTIFRMARQGKFPRGVKFGRARRWSVDEVDRWVAEQAEKAEGSN